MRQNTPRTTHTYTREKPSGLKAFTNSHGRVWAGDEDGLPVRLHHEAVEAGLDLSAAAGMRMHANAYICIRMHTSANECKRIHMNADECIHE